MVRLTVAAILAAVLQFAWGMVFWMVLPLSQSMLGRMADEDKVVEALKASNPETGVYFLPYPNDDAMNGVDSPAAQEFTKRHEAGPLVQVFYMREGHPCMDPMTFGMGFGHMLVGSFLAGGLLLMAGPGLRTYFARVLFVGALGVFAAFAINLAQPIWFHHPWKFHLLMSFSDVVSWSLAGLVLAGFLRRAD